MESYYLIVIPLLAFVVTYLILPVQINLLKKWELFDSLKDHRIHDSFTPSMGGIAVYVGVHVALIIAVPLAEWISLKYFFIASSLMFVIGLRDDVLGLSPVKKLIGQLLPIIIIVLFGKIVVESDLYGFNLTLLPDWIEFLVVIAAFVLITNAYNLIDGLDGLAGTIGIIILIFFGIWFFLADQISLSLISLCVAGSLLAFLKFNWQPSRIFMGDTGALLVGFIISFFAITFLNTIELANANPALGFRSPVGALICILIIPVFDTSRVVIFRLRKGMSPFKADKNHIHHQFLKLGYSHSQAVIRIAAINLFFIAIAILLRHQPDSVLIPLVVVLCLLINFGLKWAQSNAGTHPKTS